MKKNLLFLVILLVIGITQMRAGDTIYITYVPNGFCAGSRYSVDFADTGLFSENNHFTAQLSDSSGSFANPITIGNLIDTLADTMDNQYYNYTIPVDIPPSTPAGAHYRVRVVSHIPAITGSDNGYDLIVYPFNLPQPQLSVSGNGCIGSDTLQLNGAAGAWQISWYLTDTPFYRTDSLEYAENSCSTAAGLNDTLVNSILYYPSGVYIDAGGNIFVSDNGNNRIVKFSAGSTAGTQGIIVAGGNGSGSAANQLSGPNAVFVDSAGNIYVADGANNRIQKFPAGSTSATNGITVAGGNGFGSAANQISPSGIYVDHAGNLYVPDYFNNRIQKFPMGSTSATNGVTIAGGNGQGSAANQLSGPNAVYIDIAGNIYVADGYNSRIQKFPSGSSSSTNGITVAGSTTPGNAANQLNSPASVWLDNANNIYVTDLGNNRVQKFPAGSDSTTNAVTVAGGNGFGILANQLAYPVFTFVEDNGIFYVADGNNNRIQKFPAGSDSATQGVTVAGLLSSTLLSFPQAVCLDSSGNIYVSDYANNRIQMFPVGSGMGTAGVTVAGGNGAGNSANQFNGPEAIYVDNSGNLYVADQGNNRVLKFPGGSNSATNGVIVAGGNGQGSGANQLYTPAGLYVDKTGNLYVSDQYNNRIQKFPAGSTSATNGLTVAGGTGAGGNANQLNAPIAIYLDKNDNLFVADRYNSRIQMFPAGSSSGTSGVTVAGGAYGSLDNQMNFPFGVFLDSVGNIYVSDFGTNNRVQKFAAGGNTSTNGQTIMGGVIQGAAPYQLESPAGICVDGKGDVYVADGNNNRIQKWSPGSLNTSYLPTQPGVYFVAMVDSDGCATGSSSVVDVEICTGIAQQLMADISVYPNPTSNILFVQSGNAVITNIELINIMGQTVAIKEVNQSFCRLEVGAVAQGNYLLLIHTNDGIATKMVSILKD